MRTPQVTAGGSAGPDEHPVVARLQLQGTLATRVRRGIAWTAASRLLVIALQVASLAVVAKLLLPADYGLVAIALVFNRLAGLLTELGLTSAIVQSRRVTDRLLTTAFWLNNATGAVATLVLVALSPVVAAVYHEPRVVGILSLAALTFVLNVAPVPTALLQRTLQFRRLGTMELAGNATGVGVTIAFAASGAGAVSLVLGPLAQVLLMDVLVWTAVRWVPRGRPARAELGELWRFGRGLTGSNLLFFASRNVDTLLLGLVVPTAVLGLYSRAYQVMMLPLTQVTSMLSRVLLPAYAEMRDDRERFKAAFLTTARLSLVAGVPAGWGVAATATAFVGAVFRPQYAAMVVPLTLLAASLPPQLLQRNVGPAYQALGETGRQFRVALVSSGITIAGIVVGLAWGATGVAAALVVTSFLVLGNGVRPLMGWLSMTPADLWGIARGSLGAGLIMVAVAVAVGLALPPLPPLAVLLAQGAAGAAAYGAALWFFEPALVRPLAGRLSARLRPSARSARSA